MTRPALLRARIFYVWIVLALVIAFTATWGLAIAGVPRIEAGYLLFLLGMGFLAASPSIIRWIYRRVW